MDAGYFLEGDAIDALVGFCGEYAAAGLGISLAVYMLGYVVWFIIDVMRGGI